MRTGERRHARQIEHGRREIDRAHQRSDAGRREMPRPPEDHRHAKRRLVNEHSVRLFAVLTKTLAVVANDGDDCRGEQA